MLSSIQKLPDLLESIFRSGDLNESILLEKEEVSI